MPSLPGSLTFGRTVDEALAMAKEAIEGFIARMIAGSEKVPVETDDAMAVGVVYGIHAGAFTHHSKSPE